MYVLYNKKWVLVVLLVIASATIFVFATRVEVIDFNAQVKPILNKKCITCHGGVRRKAGFSLLFRSEALANTESGKPAIVPGHPDKSEMIRRVGLKDPEDRMPYKHEPLSKDEIHILSEWIKQGAKWGDHWSYVPVTKTALPVLRGRLWNLLPAGKPAWIKNEIDYFIYEKLQEEKIQPSAEAAKANLLRRVSLDIIGKPAPSLLEKKFLENKSENAYGQLVDSLLALPGYGERWTSVWMDVARYADTKGYEADHFRSIWRYRDWLIRSFNADKPYDQFLTEQIAGDLLPNPTKSQLIATAFHRNTLTNDEGGTDNEEFRVSAVMDRVSTTWEGLMGTTFACVQCHSHPYDPFNHDDYYKFMAFFNDSRDEDTYDDYPLLREFTNEDSISRESLQSWLIKNASSARTKEIMKFVDTWEPSINALKTDEFVNASLDDTWLGFRNHGTARLKKVNLEQISTVVYRYQSFLKTGRVTIHLDKPDGRILAKTSITKTKDWHIDAINFTPTSGIHDLYFEYESSASKNNLDYGMQMDWFCFTTSFPGAGQPGYEVNKNKFLALLNAKPLTTPIMMENPTEMHRLTHVFERGNWLVHGEEVKPDVPHSLNPFPAKAPRNRLGLAQWLTDKKNPLTARTMVNRVWEQLFGNGLVETLEDMGTQGAAPTHKELLDWLSWKFMNDYNWSIKKLVREIVMSATYRQDSKITPELLEKDPYNKLCARGASMRLTAEQVRDQALSAAGLLSDKMYGPSVMPWQPEGIWLSPYNNMEWVKSHGEDQYRRSVYTFWKRTAPYPSMIAFDGAARTSCIARRIRTNTPLQALVTLNDSVYIEVARYFAYRMQVEGGKTLKQQIAKGYEILKYTSITENKLAGLEKLYYKVLDDLKKNPGKACEIITVNDEHANDETAALVLVANAMLNLDEVLTKN